MVCIVALNAGEGAWWEITPQGAKFNPVIVRDVGESLKINILEAVNFY